MKSATEAKERNNACELNTHTHTHTHTHTERERERERETNTHTHTPPFKYDIFLPAV